MSDTVSTALTDTSAMSSVFGSCEQHLSTALSTIRLILLLLTVICMTSLFMSVTSVMFPVDDRTQSEDTVMYKPARRKCGCQKCRQRVEQFSNDVMFSYKTAERSNHQTITLTSPDNQQNAPSTMLSGQASRYITRSSAWKDDMNDNEAVYALDVHAYLYVLDGNILNQTQEKIKHHYSTYLVKEGSPPLSIGQLTKDGDGVYKLKFTSKEVQDLVTYDYLYVTYEVDNKKMVLIQGKFD